MPSRKNLALAGAALAGAVSAQTPGCGAFATFDLVGTTTDGAVVGEYAIVQDPTGDSGTNTVIFGDEAAATRFTLTPDGHLETSDGTFIADTDAGIDLTWLFFDTEAAIDAQNLEIAQCTRNTGVTPNTLTCTTTAADTLQYCNDFLSIGADGVNTDAGCVGITLTIANEIAACDATSTTTTTAVSTQLETLTTTVNGVPTTITTVAAEPITTGSSSASSMTTSTVVTTAIYTVIDCAPEVVNCPAHSTHYSTSTYAIYTTVCPVGGAGYAPAAATPVAGSGASANANAAANANANANGSGSSASANANANANANAGSGSSSSSASANAAANANSGSGSSSSSASANAAANANSGSGSSSSSASANAAANANSGSGSSSSSAAANAAANANSGSGSGSSAASGSGAGAVSGAGSYSCSGANCASTTAMCNGVSCAAGNGTSSSYPTGSAQTFMGAASGLQVASSGVVAAVAMLAFFL